MTYVQRMPPLGRLERLAVETKTYPISGLGIVQYAEHLGFDDELVNFLKLFSSRIVFNSRTDFLAHCRLLERLIRQEKSSEPERLRSP